MAVRNESRSLALESGSSDDESVSTGQSREIVMDRPLSLVRRSVAVALGLALVAFACVIFSLSADDHSADAPGATQEGSEAGTLTARSLLDGGDITEVTSRNFMNLAGNHLTPGEKHALHASVGRGLKKIADDMKRDHPRELLQLDSIPLSHEDKDAVLGVVSKMVDPRVQRVGREVLETVHKNRAEGGEAVKRHLQERFGSRLPELRALRNEVIPAALRGPDDGQHDVAFEPARMQILRELPEINHPGNAAVQLSRRLGLSVVEEMGIIGALFETLRVAMQEAAVIGQRLNQTMDCPTWAKALVGGTAFAAQLGDCIEFEQQKAAPAQPNIKDLIMCPLKFAGGFIDLVNSIKTILSPTTTTTTEWELRPADVFR